MVDLRDDQVRYLGKAILEGARVIGLSMQSTVDRPHSRAPRLGNMWSQQKEAELANELLEENEEESNQ